MRYLYKRKKRISTQHLNQTSSYEWIGTFWFPDNKEDKFSGKISYTSDKGIQLSLSTDKKIGRFSNDFISKKIMHAVVDGEKPAYLSLVNVWLSPQVTIGNPTITVLKGGSELLVHGRWLENLNFPKMAFEYDDFFNNFFLLSVKKERDAIKFSKGNPLCIASQCTINMSFFSSGTSIFSADDLDVVFFADEEEKLEQLKKVSKPIIEDGSYSFYKREKNNFVTIISDDGGSNSIRKKEWIWRQFWEMVADHSILIKHVWVYIQYIDKDSIIRNSRQPALYSYDNKDYDDKAILLPHRPINIYSFDEKASDLSVIENTIKKWFEISQDKKFLPVVHGIRRVLNSYNKMADTTQYVSLIAEIETFLDLTDQKDGDIDKLVELYASSEWKESFLKIANNKSKNETIGKWAHNVRNSIAHPKTCKKKAKGKYWKIASDPFQLQKVYAHLSGLYIKAVFLYLGGINNEHIEKYIKKFIERRISYKPIEFD